MKKNIIILMLALFVCGSSYAQNNKAYSINKCSDNWFIQAGVGASYTLSKGESFGDLVKPSLQVAVGKHFSPYAGARLAFSGIEITNGIIDADNYMINLDGLFNLNNILGGFKSDRKFNLYGILGAGISFIDNYSTPIKDESRVYLGARIGGQASVKLTNALDLNIEVNANVYPGNQNLRLDRSNTYNIASYIGLCYKFNKRRFDEVTPEDPKLLDELRDRISKQRRAIDEINANPVIKYNIVDKKIIINEGEDSEVVFRIGSYKIDPKQQVALYNIANYLKENPNATVSVIGYADAKTGNDTINNRLSKLRAEAVKNALVKKYKISEDRIHVSYKGASEQPFKINSWNRIVLLKAI